MGPETCILASALALGGAFASAAGDLDEPTCPSTAYGGAWGRSSPSGTFELCRLPATEVGGDALEYELRSAAAYLWRLRLPVALDEAIVSETGRVDGFAIRQEPKVASIAHVVAISPGGILEREWRLEARKKWFTCGWGPPPVTEIARVDSKHVAVQTGYDDLLILDANAAEPLRIFDLNALPYAPGESRRIVEWDALPGAEVVAVRLTCSRFTEGAPSTPSGARDGGRVDLGMRYFVVTSSGAVLWSAYEGALTVPAGSQQTSSQAAAVRRFEEERSQRLTAISSYRFEVIPLTEGPRRWIDVSKDSSGAWQASAGGG